MPSTLVSTLLLMAFQSSDLPCKQAHDCWLLQEFPRLTSDLLSPLIPYACMSSSCVTPACPFSYWTYLKCSDYPKPLESLLRGTLDFFCRFAALGSGTTKL